MMSRTYTTLSLQTLPLSSVSVGLDGSDKNCKDSKNKKYNVSEERRSQPIKSQHRTKISIFFSNTIFNVYHQLSTNKYYGPSN